MAPEKLQVTEDGMEAQFQVQLTATAHPPWCSACAAACCVTRILSALVCLQLAGPLSCPADLHDTRAGIMQPCRGSPARTTGTPPPSPPPQSPISCNAKPGLIFIYIHVQGNYLGHWLLARHLVLKKLERLKSQTIGPHSPETSRPRGPTTCGSSS